jgi:hypothetical protein
MAKDTIKFPQILIANRLDDGLIVWLSEAGKWTGLNKPPQKLQDSPSLQRALSRAQKDEENNLIIGPIAIPVSVDLVPELPKHKILLSGPTVRRDLGWQAETFEEISHVSL